VTRSAAKSSDIWRTCWAPEEDAVAATKEAAAATADEMAQLSNGYPAVGVPGRLQWPLGFVTIQETDDGRGFSLDLIEVLWSVEIVKKI